MNSKLVTICDQFDIEGEIVSIDSFGSGHINDTFRLITDKRIYLLQRINHEVFKNVTGLTANINKVTAYLRQMTSFEKMEILEFYKTREGQYLFSDDQGNYWRMLNFIENSFSFDRVENSEIAFEGGKAFGWFVRKLDGFPAEKLVESIPDFHNAKFRIENFNKAVEQNIAGRAGDVSHIIDELARKEKEMMLIYELGKAGEIPLRVTHNDTKINNVLFDKNNQGLCVIDLDTVMPGYVHFDFGDSIRTFTNTGDEDDKNLDNISMNIEYFKEYTIGFLSETKKILNEIEIKSLAFSAKYICYEQTIRFFTDYLNGDLYYKTSYAEHNLDRTKAQLKLLQSMEEQFDMMEEIVKEESGK